MKKIISYLLIFSMLLATVVTVLPAIDIEIEAAEEVPFVADLVETEQYPSVRNGGKYIYNIDDLAKLGSSFEGTGEEYIIQNDILVTRNIGNSSMLVLNGRNTEGRNVNIHFYEGGAQYLIGWGHDLTIKNLNLVGKIVSTNGTVHVAPLVMHGIDGSATLININSSVEIVVNNLLQSWGQNSDGSWYRGEQKIGGVIGKLDYGKNYNNGNDDYLENVVFSGSITINGMLRGPLGGIAGGGTNGVTSGVIHTGTFINCHNKGNITINGDTNGHSIGGLIGYMGNGGIFQNCSNSGTIKLTHDVTGSKVGGILGSTGYEDNRSMKFIDCVNSGNMLFDPTVSVEYSLGDFDHDTNPNGTHTATENPITGLNMGGILGCGYGFDKYLFSKCSNTGSVTNNKAIGSCIGGVIGYMHSGDDIAKGAAEDDSVRIEFCTNSGTVLTYNLHDTNKHHAGVGGIIGHVQAPGVFASSGLATDATLAQREAAITQNHKVVKILDCKNTGKIALVDSLLNTANGSRNLYAGGIVGRSYGVPNYTIQRCLNYGEINLGKSAAGWTAAAGIIGSYMTVATPYSTGVDSNGKVSWELGGSALTYGNLNILDCRNEGNVTNWLYVAGGIFGTGPQLCDNDITINVTNCINTGTVKGGYAVGGIAGMVASDTYTQLTQMGNLHFDYCINRGILYLDNKTTQISNAGIGGILGITYGDSISENRGTANGTDSGERTSFDHCVNQSNVHSEYSTTPSNIRVITYLDASGNGTTFVGGTAGYVANKFYIQNTDRGLSTSVAYNTDGSTTYTATDEASSTTITPMVRKNHWIGTGLNASDGYGYENGGESGTPNCTSTSKKDYDTIANSGTGLIYTADEFYDAFYDSTNKKIKTSAKAYNLMANITLTRDVYAEIGTPASGQDYGEISLIGGVFYGNNNTITLSGSSDYVFYELQNAAVYDLKLAGTVSTSAYTHASPLSFHGAQGDLVLRNISSSATITHTPSDSSGNQGYGTAGGVISKLDSGSGYAVLENLAFTGSITMNGKVSAGVGGIVGNAMGDVIIRNCHNNASGITVVGNVSTANDLKGGVGGIVGGMQGTIAIENCTSNSTVTADRTAGGPMAGGIVGAIALSTNDTATSTNEIRIEDCKNTKNVQGGLAAGGVLGGSSMYALSGAYVNIISCSNKGNVSGYSVAGGLVGDLTSVGVTLPLAITEKSANTGAVSATAGAAGGAVGVAANMMLGEVANTGAVSGTNYVGGLVGKTISGSTSFVQIANSVNRGKVSGTNYVGGIAGSLSGKIILMKAANGGDVTASDTSSTNVYAGGVAAYADNIQIIDVVNATNFPSKIENCANSGAVTVAKASSAGSLDVTAAGIIARAVKTGDNTNKIAVNGAISTGVVGTNGGISLDACYPVSNPAADNMVMTDNVANNLYQADIFGVNLGARNASLYTLSTPADSATTDAAADDANLLFYDTNDLVYRINQADEGLAANLYVGDQKTNLNTTNTAAKTLLNADWTVASNWVEQPAANTAEAALYTTVCDYTSSAGYVVYIPEYILLDNAVDLDVLTYSFDMHCNIKVSFDPSNDYVLVNDQTSQVTMDYEFFKGPEGSEELCATDELLIELGDKENALGNVDESVRLIAKAKAGEKENNFVAGTYSDRVSFNVAFENVPIQ